MFVFRRTEQEEDGGGVKGEDEIQVKEREIRSWGAGGMMSSGEGMRG